MNDQPKIDPRYDPAFQRGFTGEVETGRHPHGAIRATQPPTQAQAQPSTQAPSAEPAPRRAAPLADAAVPPAYEVWPDETDDAEFARDEVVEADEAPARPLTRNPFIIVLGLLGAALVVAGGSWAIAGRATMTDTGSLASERDYWYVQAALVGAPVTIAAGVLIIAGVLFMFANAWNHARPTAG
jgi:hypothetical protein